MNPLVSIGIISYNNAEFIGECIESCLMQTYNNFEIIVADDGSTDSSPDIIREYAEKNPDKIRFVLLKKNLGVAYNFNEAAKMARGDWFKIIACDDILMPNCIDLYMKEIEQKKIQSGILFARVMKFGEYSKSNGISDIPVFFSLQDEQRLKSLIMMNTLIAPSAFFNTRTLCELGWADERYAFLEDYPLWIKAQLSGVSMYCIDAVTVQYRLHESVSSSKNRIGNIKYIECCNKYSKEVVWPLRRGWGRIKNIEEYIQNQRIIYSIKWFGNKKTFMYYVLEICTKPLKIYSVINRIASYLKN